MSQNQPLGGELASLGSERDVPWQEGFEVIGADGLGKFSKEAREIKHACHFGEQIAEIKDELVVSGVIHLKGAKVPTCRSS